MVEKDEKAERKGKKGPEGVKLSRKEKTRVGVDREEEQE